MEDFIGQVAAKLGISEEQCRTATGGILKVIRDRCGSSEFAAILAQIPGAESMLEKAEHSPAPESGGGGLMGSLTQMAGGLLGGKSGAAMSVMGALNAAGIDAAKARGFLQTLINYLRKNLDGDTAKALLSQIGDQEDGG